MTTTTFTPIWVENPYTGQKINVEPLFRFNEEMRNPLVQSKPLTRTAIVLLNALLYMGQSPVKGSDTWKTMNEIAQEVGALISAIGKMEAMSNQPTI